MNNSAKKITLEEVQKARNEYRLARSQRSPRADLAPPTVLGIIDPDDGTLSAAAVRADLEVQVPAWDNLASFPGDLDVLYLQWAPGHAPAEDEYIDVDTATFEAGQDDPDIFFPVTVKVPLARLAPDGPYTLRYYVQTMNGQKAYCLPVPIICDSTPPWKHYPPDALILPITELTQDILDDLPQEGMECTLPSYDDWQQGDEVVLYWITTPLPADPGDLPDRPAASAPVTGPQDSKVNIPLSVLTFSQDKDYYAIYVLRDKAGNLSALSAYTKVDVALGTWPSGLQDPVVPLAAGSGDRLINLPDAQIGVDVEIPRFDHYKPTDAIEVTWGTAVLGREQIGSNPVFPLSIRVPSLDLISQYDRVIGGQQETNVSYRVLRGELPAGERAISVAVDFSVVGPNPVPDPDPDWPDPSNDQLPVPEVLGRTSQTPNKLNRTDANQSAELTVNLYSPLHAGEVIDFYWGSQLVTEARHVVKTSDTAGDPITVKIPWARIVAEGNHSALPVYYGIHLENSENEQQCDPILVEVDVVTITPDAPKFLGLTTNGWLSCDALYADPSNPNLLEPAVRVEVPDLSQYLSVGDEVTLTWTAFNGRTNPTPISSATKIELVTLGGATPVTGFIWLVQPYADHILPTYQGPSMENDGLGRVKYEFQLNGETITSLEAQAVVSMYNAAGSCPIPPRP